MMVELASPVHIISFLPYKNLGILLVILMAHTSQFDSMVKQVTKETQVQHCSIHLRVRAHVGVKPGSFLKIFGTIIIISYKICSLEGLHLDYTLPTSLLHHRSQARRREEYIFPNTSTTKSRGDQGDARLR